MRRGEGEDGDAGAAWRTPALVGAGALAAAMLVAALAVWAWRSDLLGGRPPPAPPADPRLELARIGPVFPPDPWSAEPRREGPGGPSPDEAYCLSKPYAEPYCASRTEVARVLGAGARYWLLRGDAELSSLDLGCESGGLRDLCLYPGDVRYRNALDRAMIFWAYAADWGKAFGAQASLQAQRRIQAHTVQCRMNAQSLSRISRSADSALAGQAGGREVIRLDWRQRALQALGYYGGVIDGQYGPGTREAVRDFQRELGYDETGALTPRQTTHLMCHAAQTARDPATQNSLGIMYAAGLGVIQNTDLALEWFETAARRGDADAYFNLAMIYGTGAVLGSYRLCGIVENPERADAYLREAEQLGHLIAVRWRRTPTLETLEGSGARWRRIKEEMQREIDASGRDSITHRLLINLADLSILPPGCLDTPRD